MQIHALLMTLKGKKLHVLFFFFFPTLFSFVGLGFYNSIVNMSVVSHLQVQVLLSGYCGNYSSLLLSFFGFVTFSDVFGVNNELDYLEACDVCVNNELND